MTQGKIVDAATVLEDRIKVQLGTHLSELGYTNGADGMLVPPESSKDRIRQVHSYQRRERLQVERTFLDRRADELIEFFARGTEVDPAKIHPELEVVRADTTASEIFRLATLSWSVPVSRGYGRRLRFLVWDTNTKKLMGVLALGDPSFNLHARDTYIGWNTADREARLVHMLDAFVLGAVPPYNALLAGKLIACLVRSREIVQIFRKKYSSTAGQISGRRKHAGLVAVTTTSSLGRSSMYARLTLDSLPYFRAIGYTGGWGHFHVPQNLFGLIRQYLALKGHPYAHGYEFGDGPNWRIRTIRAALTLMGVNADVLRHGVQRQLFIAQLADNALEILQGTARRPVYQTLRSVDDIGELARDRWLVPRAARDLRYREWRPQQYIDEIRGILASTDEETAAAAD